MKALAAIFGALVVGFVLVAGTIEDNHEDSAAADAAIAEQAEAFRFAKAAQEQCGPNAAWTLIESHTIQCLMHTGRKTITVRVTP